jgi:glycosyltransferase involved in cell wall biosynthesis
MMKSKEQFILIGNYPRDRQESMQRFTEMLSSGFNKVGYPTKIWKPKVIFGSFFRTTTSGTGKWLGYIDKWVIFPMILQIRLIIPHSNTRYHICDHSNAPYLKNLPKENTAITCHDVIAIRGSLGFADAYCPASNFGKILQRWILSNLRKAKLLASVSKLTLMQLQELVPELDINSVNWTVIHNAFNANFFPLSTKACESLLSDVGIDLGIPFILHVGSNLPRKNRCLLLDMVAALGDKWKGNICFAGKLIDDKTIMRAAELGLRDRIITVVKPDHKTLLALYTKCDAFVFPSFSEGFGWPVIEAQACGAPVIASSIEPMPEISGGAALHANPNNPLQFAEALLSLQNTAYRKRIVEAGFQNILRFNEPSIIQQYLNLHNVSNNDLS